MKISGQYPSYEIGRRRQHCCCVQKIREGDNMLGMISMTAHTLLVYDDLVVNEGGLEAPLIVRFMLERRLELQDFRVAFSVQRWP